MSEGRERLLAGARYVRELKLKCRLIFGTCGHALYALGAGLDGTLPDDRRGQSA